MAKLPLPTHPSDRALSITVTLLSSWLMTLGLLLTADLEQVPILWLGGAVCGRTFLHTGLFVLAHDAMHQNLWPQQQQLNHRIGQVCVWLYAFLSYHQCHMNHRQHHKIPAQVGDPDFHDGICTTPWGWYLKFLSGYLSRRQFAIFTSIWASVLAISWGIFAIAPLNILLFWVLPLILSSMQLFLLGTYFPHRQGTLNPSLSNPQNALTHTIQICWSLLSCYHFSQYHWEHHRYPRTPWYELPYTAQPQGPIAFDQQLRKQM